MAVVAQEHDKDELDALLTPKIEEEEEEHSNTILVELGPKGKGRIFHEYEPRHPSESGEVLVVDGRVTEVYPTPRVTAALGAKILKQSKAKKATPTIEIADVVDVLNIVPSAAKVAPSADLTASLQAQITALTLELAQLRAQQEKPAKPATK